MPKNGIEAEMRPRRTIGTGGLIRKKNSPYYYGLYRVAGRQRCVSLKTTSRQAAERALQQIMGSAAKGEPPTGMLRRVKYEEIRQTVLDDYRIRGARSLKGRRDGTVTIDGLKHLDAFFGGMAVVGISTELLRRFIQTRQDQGARAATINRNLALLRRMFSLARQEGRLMAAPHFPMLKEAKPRQGFLVDEQFKALRNELPERLRALVTFLYFTGCRLGAALKIRWEQVDLERREIRLEEDQTKNAEAITLPLPKDLVEMLQAQPTGERVFAVGSFRTAWENACARLGLGEITLSRDAARQRRRYRGLLVHDLRRSGVRNLIRDDVTETVAMKISGHKTRHIFERYNITDTADIRAAIGRREKSFRKAGRAVKNDASLMRVRPMGAQKVS
jgi:integrase